MGKCNFGRAKMRRTTTGELGGCAAIPSRPMWLRCHTITTQVAVLPYHHDPPLCCHTRTIRPCLAIPARFGAPWAHGGPMGPMGPIPTLFALKLRKLALNDPVSCWDGGMREWGDGALLPPILGPIPAYSLQFIPRSAGQQSWVCVCGGGTPVGSELARPPAARPPPARRVCWLGRESHGTPKPIFLPPNGSPCHHFGHGDRAQTQNCGAVLTRGVPPPQSQLFFDPFWTPKMGKCQFL